MIDIIRVYDIVRDIANKDQKGFVTANVFNSFAQVAQLNVYNEMFKERTSSVALRRGKRDDARHKSMYKFRDEDLKMYVRNLVLTTDVDSDTFIPDDPDNPESVYANTISDTTALTFNRPRDLMHDIQLVVTGTNTVIEMIYDIEKANRVLNSNLSAPTTDFPVCLQWGEQYSVFPTDIAGVELRYYRRPASRYAADQTIVVQDNGTLSTTEVFTNEIDYTSVPTYSAQELDQTRGYTVPDIRNCRNFDLPSHRMSEVIYEICELIGINLRDGMLTQYAVGESKSE